MNRLLSATELLEFALSRDMRSLVQFDRAVTFSLYRVTSEDHEDSLKICYYLSLIEPEGHHFLESIETAHSIIEDLLDPEKFLDQALKIFQAETIEERIKSPLWLFFSRSTHGQSENFKNLLISHFPENPSFFSEVMDKTKDQMFLETMEKCLTYYAPIVKYLPFIEDSHEFFWPHDLWLRVGSSYSRLLQLNTEIKVKRLPEFLENKFLSKLPKTLEEWKKTAVNKDLEHFDSCSELYHAQAIDP